METIKNDILDGAEAIGEFLGIKRARVYVLARNTDIPLFRLNRKISARKSSLLKWIEGQEQKGTKSKGSMAA